MALVLCARQLIFFLRFPQMTTQSNLPPIYYKIVETKEDCQTLLSPVPWIWENEGKLMWPPKDKQEKALKNPLLPPGTLKDGWSEFNCVVKRSFIPTYSEALQEIRQMSDKSDTSDNETLFTVPTTSLTSKRRSAGARKIVSLATNADAERSNFNQVYFASIAGCFLTINMCVYIVILFQFATPNSAIEQRNESIQNAVASLSPSPRPSTPISGTEFVFQSPKPHQQAQFVVQPMHQPHQQTQFVVQSPHQPHQQAQFVVQSNEQAETVINSSTVAESQPQPITQQIVQDVRQQQIYVMDQSTSQLRLLTPEDSIQFEQQVDDGEAFGGETDIASMLLSLMNSHVKLQAKVEYSINLQEQILVKLNSTTAETAPATNMLMESSFEPIDTIEQIIEFEAKLASEEFVAELVSILIATK